jgi:hypothetical protein
MKKLSVLLLVMIVTLGGLFAEESKTKSRIPAWVKGFYLSAGMGYGYEKFEGNSYAMPMFEQSYNDATYGWLDAKIYRTYSIDKLVFSNFVLNFGSGYDFEHLKNPILKRFGVGLYGNFQFNNSEQKIKARVSNLMVITQRSSGILVSGSDYYDPELKLKQTLNASFGLELFGKPYTNTVIDIIIPLGFRFNATILESEKFQNDTTLVITTAHIDMYSGIEIDFKIGTHFKICPQWTIGGAISKGSKLSLDAGEGYVWDANNSRYFTSDNDVNYKLFNTQFIVAVKANL